MMEEVPKDTQIGGPLSQTGSPTNQSFRIFETKTANKTKSSTRDELIFKKGELILLDREEVESTDEWVWGQRVAGGNSAWIRRAHLKPFKVEK